MPPAGDAGRGSAGSNFDPLTSRTHVRSPQLSCRCPVTLGVGSPGEQSVCRVFWKMPPGEVRRVHTHPLQMFVNDRQGCGVFTEQKAPPVRTRSLYLGPTAPRSLNKKSRFFILRTPSAAFPAARAWGPRP